MCLSHYYVVKPRGEQKLCGCTPAELASSWSSHQSALQILWPRGPSVEVIGCFPRSGVTSWLAVLASRAP